MFGLFHIHRNGRALCHAGEGIYITFDDADGMNPDNCCPDCRRRYQNIAKMQKLPSAIAPINKALLRALCGADEEE